MDAATAAVVVRSLSVVRAARPVVRDVSFTVDRGQLVALRGASGSGKTTVLRALAGLEPIAEGIVDIAGVRLRAGARPSGPTLRALSQGVGVVFQFHNLFTHLSALENVCVAPIHVAGRDAMSARRDARGLLDALGVGHRAGAMPHELSGGEAQRVAIARALATQPSVLLMDEPTASLDADRRADLARLLRGLAAEGRAVVVVTHDHEFVRAAADREVVLEHGTVAGGDAAPAAPGGVS